MSTILRPQDSHLVRRVEQPPRGTTVRTWTLRDDNNRHYHGAVSIADSPLHLRLRWRATAASPVHEVGLFWLDLRALLAEDLVRPESDGAADDRIRLRFVRADDRRIYIQWRAERPSLAIGEVPQGP